MRTVDLHRRASTDIELIADFGVENFGAEQAEIYQQKLFTQFEFLAAHPFVGRPLDGDTRGFLKFGYGSHTIIYSVSADNIVIRRVLHARADILMHL